MTIRTVTAVAVECEHRDGNDACQSVLTLRLDPVEPPKFSEVRIAAAARGWAVDDGERCPKHHPATTAAPTAETGA